MNESLFVTFVVLHTTLISAKPNRQPALEAETKTEVSLALFQTLGCTSITQYRKIIQKYIMFK